VTRYECVEFPQLSQERSIFRCRKVVCESSCRPYRSV